MEDAEPSRKRVRSRRNENRKENFQKGGIHGLVGLEISSLSKSINGQSNYNFDKYLKNSIPEQYTIEIINDIERHKDIIENMNLNEIENDEISEFEKLCNGNLNKLMNSINGKFDIELVDHERNKGPSQSIFNVGIDPLDDFNYSKIHDKLARKERKFNLTDRNKMLNEVDNCIELLSLLGTELKRGTLKETLRNYVVEDIELSDEQIFRLSQLLGSITKINDPTDSIEMILKFRLTIREIRSFLLNFIKIKSLETHLKKEIQKINSGQLNRYIEPTTDSDINELRNKRLLNRNIRMGPIVKVNFKQGVTLVVDPITKPQIINK
ncbi:hypothetical protein C6P40_000177 [Pichia californica]|uniref:Something about silencing protein 4 domain-containing protein n=1 Tax=Pichia californica TaxID=460514 RepID=A0A9P7BGD4_9ASCO|nr:hypothetical protein C6P42_003663 [[Candida] californica]KAG0689075.1 hypothetical protein C6P40_000177 [[Candida] californica]